MSDSFNPKHGPILVTAEVTGPTQSMAVDLILDTGATTSLLSEATLTTSGYDLATVTDRAQMTTGSLVTSVPRVVLTRLSALGRHRYGFPVLAYTLRASASVRGLLRLDFFRDGIPTLDFRAGQITLA
jgi:hypothetical protein